MEKPKQEALCRFTSPLLPVEGYIEPTVRVDAAFSGPGLCQLKIGDFVYVAERWLPLDVWHVRSACGLN